MGDTSEFSWSVRLFLRAYRWRRIDPVPWVPLRRPLAESRLALVSSAGFVLPDQPGFDHDYRGGDPSFREIPVDTDTRTLVESHRSETFDHAGVLADPNLAFPLDRLRELRERGRIGSLASMQLSFMGSITAPGRLVRDTAPAAVEALVADDVDVALLVPV
jgi:D-proline reductase (dithiol) PrdB